MPTHKQILIATANKGKIEEIKRIFKDTSFQLKFLSDYEEQIKGLQIQENAKSFEGNALIKALIVGEALQILTLADDSGLCVDALGGRPGVLSARYTALGKDQDNYERVLKELDGFPLDKRGCHYNCTVAIYDPMTKFVETVSGTWAGRIALAPKGNKSFGYAPIFLAQEYDYKQTNAEFDPEELIDINHRGFAFRKAIAILEGYFVN